MYAFSASEIGYSEATRDKHLISYLIAVYGTPFEVEVAAEIYDVAASTLSLEGLMPSGRMKVEPRSPGRYRPQQLHSSSSDSASETVQPERLSCVK